jgi:hypothetical protein
MLNAINGDVFEAHCEPIEVTRLSRPDTAWRFIDAHGHEHRWHVGETPAGAYSPSEQYEVPSILWVHEKWGSYEDGSRYSIGHHECRACGDRVTPRHTSDTTRQYIPGPRSYFINGEPVSQDEFEARWKAQHG